VSNAEFMRAYSPFPPLDRSLLTSYTLHWLSTGLCLFILHTDYFRSTQWTWNNCHLIKFADDTILLSRVSGPSQHHGPTLQEFVEWCDNSSLKLNVNKTKEMEVTFSNKQRQMTTAVTIIIHGKPIEIVEEYKYKTICWNLLPTRRRNLGNSSSNSTF